jgi:hypothetical protein
MDFGGHLPFHGERGRDAAPSRCAGELLPPRSSIFRRLHLFLLLQPPGVVPCPVGEPLGQPQARQGVGVHAGNRNSASLITWRRRRQRPRKLHVRARGRRQRRARRRRHTRRLGRSERTRAGSTGHGRACSPTCGRRRNLHAETLGRLHQFTGRLRRGEGLARVVGLEGPEYLAWLGQQTRDVQSRLSKTLELTAPLVQAGPESRRPTPGRPPAG